MFPDSFLVQLLVFGLAQVAAWRNMLTGRFGLGFLQFAVTFGLADVLLVLRFVIRDATAYESWLILFQVVGLLAAVEFGFRRLRWRSAAFQEGQRGRFGRALDDFMAGRDADALRGFRRVFRRDPWNASSACMVAGLLADRGRRLAARWWYWRAGGRADDPILREQIQEEVRCLKARRTERPETAPSRPDPAEEPRMGEPTRPRKRSRAAG